MACFRLFTLPPLPPLPLRSVPCFRLRIARSTSLLAPRLYLRPLDFLFAMWRSLLVSVELLVPHRAPSALRTRRRGPVRPHSVLGIGGLVPFRFGSLLFGGLLKCGGRAVFALRDFALASRANHRTRTSLSIAVTPASCRLPRSSN